MILSGRTDVSFSADTVRKVRETAEALGYAPTAKKRPSLFDRKTVLIVCPNVLNPYYSTIVQAIQQAAADKDCDTLVYTTYRDAENEIRILNAVAGSDLAGVVFTMMPQSTELVERVNRLVPVVVIGDRNTSLNVDTVEMNNYSAGAIIAHYMIGLGHKHIAYISTTLNEANSARVRRLEGVRKQLIVEEAWKALSSANMAEYLRYMYKTVRKYYGEAIVVTQEVDDIISSPVVKESIINNSDCKILLDQRKYMNKFDAIQSLLGLTEKEKSQILSINMANNPSRLYKEVWIGLGGTQSAVYATEVSAEEYLAYTTEETEKVEVYRLAEQLGGDIEAVIRQLAERRRKKE